jgi:alpha-glucosidase (family GH31 glycosyl hydrolase)
MFLVLLAAFLPASASGKDSEGWGVNALVLKAPWPGAPSVDDLLADGAHTVVLDRFYRAGGIDRPATPTECRVSYDNDALNVVFRCKEKDMAFPTSDLIYPVNQSAGTNRLANWMAMFGSPGGCDSWPPFPDEVDVLIQPDPASPSYYQFSVTPDGAKYGREYTLNTNSPNVPDERDRIRGSTVAKHVDVFEATVTKHADEWVVSYRIPWATLGGLPSSHFGFLPMRTRWRDGEFSSPVAIDFEECLPVDLLIETSFSGSATVKDADSSLCQLPSGIFRWQRPAFMFHPDAEMREQIWQLESSLGTPTDMKNLGQRIDLAQNWMDLMTGEGFQPLPRAWGDVTNNLILALWRQKVNLALEQNDTTKACQILDSYLSQLDTMSRWWYADSSPGDILKDHWQAVAKADSLEVSGNTLVMHGTAGGHPVDLHLVLPQTGGVRIFGKDEGFFKPDQLLPLNVKQSSGSCTITTADGKVVIQQNPFSVAFYNAAGEKVTEIAPGKLAFLFDADGQITGVDFRTHLDTDEVIYGFGEKYDNFNQHGHVLTLWGADDWVGNGLGLRNTTYKLVPVIHSSKGYMIFDDSSYRLRADVGVADAHEFRITQPGPIFDYYFWVGTPKHSLESYTALTGTPPLPPKWVFEPWMGRGGGAWAAGPLHNAVAEETNTYFHFAALDIPHSAIYAEGSSANSPFLNEFMTAHNIKVLGYFMPAQIRVSAGQGGGGFGGRGGRRSMESLMPELKHDDLPFLRFPNGDVAPSAGDNYIDFYNPNAMELIRRALKPALDLGNAGSMVDFGDLVPDAAVFYNGKRGAEMHNFYSYEYHKTVSEYYRERRGDDFILYGRAATPGDQHWVGQFAGDHSSNFDGLKAVLTGALNLCACGFSTWGSDLGGYFGLPEPAVYMRWIEFGCFSPIWRPHGKATRDPWYFGDAAVASYKYDAWVRENILNYTCNAAAVSHDTGIPIMRSMPLSFPGEQSVAPVRDQYMFGDYLLVAPVLNEDTSRTVLFPAGAWTGLWDGKTVSGPAKLDVSAPLDTIPVYLKQGAVVSVQLDKALRFGESMTPGRVNALVVTPPKKTETVSILNGKGELANVPVQTMDNGGFGWVLENLPDMNYVIVYGISNAGTVKLDGEVVPAQTGVAFDQMAPGWEADTAGNRLIVRLPDTAPGQTRPPATVEVDPKALSQ